MNIHGQIITCLASLKGTINYVEVSLLYSSATTVCIVMHDKFFPSSWDGAIHSIVYAKFSCKI
jgi:hypothetical protein